MKKLNKKFKKLISIFILICIVLLLILICSKFLIKKTVKPSDLDPKDDDILNLSGFSVLFEGYTGDFNTSDIASHLTEISTNLLPEMFNKVKYYNDNKRQEYYDEYSYKLKKNLGVKSFDEFNTLINDLKDTNIDLNNWYRLDVIENTFIAKSDKKGYSYVEYEVQYKTDETIRFSLYVAENANKLPPYIIKVVK